MKKCIQCGVTLALYANKYCSNQCQSDYAYSLYIAKWQRNEMNGGRGIHTRNLSAHIVRYIMKKYMMKCARCGWHEVNPTTGNVPLEIDHIDGDAENNREDNLILLYPNCHSLTISYKNLNKGHGRLWRREKYVRIV